MDSGRIGSAGASDRRFAAGRRDRSVPSKTRTRLRRSFLKRLLGLTPPLIEGDSREQMLRDGYAAAQNVRCIRARILDEVSWA